MANKKQLAILKQGVKTWNQWREKNPTAKINLIRANLGEAADLRYINLYLADFQLVHLIAAKLTGADLRGANLGGVNFYKANLHGADLFVTNLSNADLSEADLNEAKIGGTIFGNVDLKKNSST